MKNRNEVFNNMEIITRNECNKLGVKLVVVPFTNQIRFHIDGEMRGWFRGQCDIVIARTNPSQKSIDKAYSEFNNWINDLPNQTSEYNRLMNEGKLAFYTEVNNRYQKINNTNELHSLYKDLLNK
jgi:hypothetical protein